MYIIIYIYKDYVGNYEVVVDFAMPIELRLHREIIVYPHPDRTFVITLKVSKIIMDGITKCMKYTIKPREKDEEEAEYNV
jgi:hypothetical protein